MPRTGPELPGQFQPHIGEAGGGEGAPQAMSLAAGPLHQLRPLSPEWELPGAEDFPMRN